MSDLVNEAARKARFQSEFENAIELEEKGDLQGALEVLDSLASRVPNSANILCRKGNVEWEMNDRPAAVRSFRKAVERAPQFVTPSLGLFHCLWEQELKEEAFEEARRFTRETGSDEYAEIFETFGAKAE